MKMPTVDNVKIRVRSHNPKVVWEEEFPTIDEAIQYLHNVKFGVIQTYRVLK